jgi:hypothetical protein
VKVNNAFLGTFDRLSQRIKGFRGFRSKMAAEVIAAGQSGRPEEIIVTGDDFQAGFGAPSAGQGFKESELKELLSNALKFDIGVLLRLRTFVYLLAGTGIFLFQTYNTLAIINLAQQNDKLRNEIQMSTSVITSQELKVHELQSIHNIAKDAVSLGLTTSSAPPVEIEP